MTLEEYKALIDKMIANPDTAAATADEIINNLKADTNTLAELEAMHAENEKRIKDLQETNIKLFMSRGGSDEDSNPDDGKPEIPEDVGQARADAIAESFGTSYFEDKFKKVDKKED